MIIIPYDFEAKKKGLRKLHKGPVRFTCPDCGTSSELQFERMIFHKIEFFCECGKPFKIINPAFVPPNK